MTEKLNLFNYSVAAGFLTRYLVTVSSLCPQTILAEAFFYSSYCENALATICVHEEYGSP